MEKVCDTRTILVQQVCDVCGDGLMTFTGKVVEDAAPISFASDMFSESQTVAYKTFEHKCQMCGHTDKFNAIYPINRVLPTESLREPTDEEKVSD